jgi:hypothetical protein
MKKLLLLLALLPSFLLSQDTWVNIEFQFDQYADEVSWSLSNDYGVVASGGNYEYQQPNAFHVIDSLESGEYTFELLDAFGDGLSWPNDGYCLVSNTCQDTLFFAQGNYGIGLIESLTIAPCAPPEPAIIDCMDENAINYNPDADVNDSMLCEYPPCESIDNIYVEQTCDGGSAILYYNWDSSDNPNCNIIQITYGSEDTNAYTFDTDIDNGIWGVYAGNGQMPPNWEDEFYAQFITADSLVSDTVFFTPYPCTQGCTNADAPNYNPWATVDDGSCGGQACDIGYTSITVDITLDNWPGETGWSIVSGGVIDEHADGDYNYQDIGQTFSYSYCVMEAGFEFIISDTYGDGLAGSTSGGTLDGDVLIRGCNGDTITQLSNGNWLNAAQENVGVGFGNVAYSGWQEVPVCGGPEEILGCLDSDYQEFNPLANVDDDSCLNEHIFGCINENAFNYNPNATQMEIYPTCNYELWIGDAGADGWGNSFLGVVQGNNQWSFTMGPGEYEQTFPIWLETDKPVKIYYFEVGGAQTPPEEVEFQTLHNSFKLTDQNGVVLIHEGWNPFADNGQGALQPFAPPFFQTYQAMPFCGTLCIPTVLGCIDSEALNFNEEANTDDGSCIEIIEGCTQAIAFNYNPDANFDDGSCVPEIIGCMDNMAWNYNEDANVGDDSCLYFGCTDPEAQNYNYIANVDNGSCLYPGCTDSSALNFNSTANTDDGSCILPIYGCTDSTAFNYDATANTDNDSCIPVIEGCTNIFAFNYDVFANTDDGSCILIVYGCTDATALNYDPDANVDNDSCIEIVYGCTDSTAFNYNADANTEDFSCIEIVYGCTDENAFNYNELANTDNGTCIDILIGCTDVNAFNYDANVNTDDGSCEYDAECSGGPGIPYWLPNECFEWVISIDTECCTGDWNSYCIELYNYCEFGWPIDLEEISSELLIYPNPVSDILNITQEIDIKVYDMVGNLIISKEKTTQIDMTNLPSGIYNLNINHNDKIINNRIIKQ